MCLAAEDTLSLRRGSDSVRDVRAIGSKGVTCEAGRSFRDTNQEQAVYGNAKEAGVRGLQLKAKVRERSRLRLGLGAKIFYVFVYLPILSKTTHNEYRMRLTFKSHSSTDIGAY
jgi:hypothetical protein